MPRTEPTPKSFELYLKNLRASNQKSLQDILNPQYKEIGLLERPGRFVSELLTGGDPLKALIHGKAEKESLGYQVFESARKPGFQLGDIGAFAIDVATDPLTYALGPLIGKLGAAAGIMLPRAQKAKMFQQMAVDLLDGVMPAAKRRNAIVGHMKQMGVDPKWQGKILKDIGEEFGTKMPSQFKFLKKDQVDLVLSKLMNYEVLTRPKAAGIGGKIRRTMSLQLAPISSVFRNHGGVWGNRIAEGLDRMQRTMISNLGDIDSQFIDVIKGAGLYGGAQAPIRKAASLLVESGSAKTGIKNADGLAAVLERYGVIDDSVIKALDDPRAMDLAKWLEGRTKARGIQMANYRDHTGQGFMTQVENEAGEKVIVRFEDALQENYVPHMWHHDFAPGNAGFEKAAKALRKKLKARYPKANIGIEEARTRLRMMSGDKPAKVGTVNYGRVKNAGQYELDPAEWFPRWMAETEEQLQFADNFLINGDGLTILEDGIKNNDMLPRNWVDSIGQIIRGKGRGGDRETSDIIRRITGLQVVTKMGIGSAISNASQSINTITRDGFFNFARGFTNVFSDEGHRLALLSYNKTVREGIAQAAGHSTKGMAAKYLDITGFNWIEKWNRYLAANSSVVTAKRMAQQYMRTKSPRLRDRLLQYGLDESDIQALDAGVELGRKTMDRIALTGAEVTQHATNWHQLPKVWQVPEMRIFLQYKNFAYNQTRFLFREVMQPAFQFIGSGGKQGTMAPLLRVAPFFVGAGQGVAHLRDLIKIPVRGIAEGDWEGREEWFWESDDWFADALRDSLMVGSFGIVGDAIEAAERGKLPAMLLGPTVGDVSEAATRLAQITGRTARGRETSRQWQNFSNWLLRRTVPGLSAHTPFDVQLIGR